MTSELAAYLAGLLDGEGSFQIIRRRHQWNKRTGRGYSYAASLSIKMTDNAAVVMLKREIPGSRTYLQRFACGHRRPLYTWELPYRASEPVLHAVLPYLVVKRNQAMLLLDFLRAQGQAVRTRRFDAAYWAHQDYLQAELRLIHHTSQIIDDAIIAHSTPRPSASVEDERRR